MSRPTESPRHGRLLDIAAALGVLLVSVVGGYLLARHSEGVAHNRMLPWILARSFGLAAYLALALLVAAGIWFRHPWRVGRRTPGPEAILRLHTALAVATICLLCGHVLATALDSYAGVGWSGVFVPWHSAYRPTAIALGTLSLYGILLVSGTAALAGSLARRLWLPIHSVSAVLFGVCVAHGLLAGSDSGRLWWIYLVSGVVVLALQTTRSLARRVVPAEAW